MGRDLIRQELKALQGGERTSYWVRLLDANRPDRRRNRGHERAAPDADFSSARNCNAGRNGEQDYPDRRASLFSLVSVEAKENGQVYLIQVAQDRSVDEQFETEFGILVVVVLVCGNFCFRHDRGDGDPARPPAFECDDPIRSCGSGPTRLHERVPVAEWPRELQPVAIAFDDMLDRLEDSFNRLSQFSADLAHELRTPLANIRGEAEVALTRPRSPNEYQAVIESSMAECARLSGIIDNLLFLARAEAAESKVQLRLIRRPRRDRADRRLQ